MRREETAETDGPSTPDAWRDGALSIAEAGEFLRISRSEIYRLMEDGSLASTKLGRRRVVARRSLVELLERGA